MLSVLATVLQSGTGTPSHAQPTTTPLSVYVLRGGDEASDSAVIDALQEAGHVPTIGVETRDWDGTQANLRDFDTVVILNNFNWGVISSAGAQAIRDYIANGGSVVTGEWFVWGAFTGSALGDALPVAEYCGWGFDGATTYTQATPDPIINAGLPSAFTFSLSNVAGTESCFTPKANATVFYSSSHGGGQAGAPGLVGWNFESGRVASFSTLLAATEFASTDYRTLFVNTVEWVSGARSDVLQVGAVSPASGGNTGAVTVTIRGSNFAEGTSVRLLDGDTVAVTGQNTRVISSVRIQTTFGLQGQSPRQLQLQVVTPDGHTAAAPQPFAVERGTQPEVWVDVIGRPFIRTGREQTFTVIYGNRGNVDAVGVPIYLTGIPSDARVRAGFEVTPAPLLEGQDPAEWSDLPIFFNGDDSINLPLLVSSIPPGDVGSLSFGVTVPTVQDFELHVWANPCSVDDGVSGTLNPDWSECLLAIGDVAREFLGRINGGCVAAFQRALLEFLKQYIPRIIHSGPKALFSSPDALGKVVHEVLNALPECAGEVLEALPVVRTVADAIWLFQVGKAAVGALDKCGEALARLVERFISVRAVEAFDPNEKIGSSGVGQARFLSDQEPLRYQLFFENLETATAPAQEVIVTDQLDAAKLDLDTLTLGPITFGNKQVTPPPGVSEFTTGVDLRPEQNLIVQITARLDRDTGLLTWRLASMDPDTRQPPEDPLAGFLPPNKNAPEGQGTVLFTVMPRDSLPTGTEIGNKASIVFDTNPPIDTQEWRNTIDRDRPTSQVLPLAAGQASSSFEVRWSGADVGAGVLDYTIFVSEDGGPYTPWLRNATATSETFTGRVGRSYAFYSVARDRTGNLEDAPTTADASTRVLNAPILFASTRTGNGDIYAIDPAGRAPVQLTSGNAIDAEPAWSPDGKQIAFTSTRAGNVELYVMDPDGSNVTRLTTHAAIDTSPAWSPDGTKLAFASNRGRNWDIYVMDASGGGNVTRLTSHAAADTLPAWSPDGSKIAFSSTRTGAGDIYSMNANGSSATRLTTSPGIDLEPAWSGSTIAFSTNRHGVLNFELYTMNDNGSGQTRRTVQPGLDVTPAWSSDGTQIVFATNRPAGSNFEIYTMNADGSRQTQVVAHPAADLFPDW